MARALAGDAPPAAAPTSSATPSTTGRGWLFLVDEAERGSSRSTNAEMQDGEGLDTVDGRGSPGGASRSRPRPASRTRSTSRTPASSTRSRPPRRTSRPCAASAARRARARGSSAIEVEGGKVRASASAGELLPCDTVVLAAGPWSLALGRTAGIELPLEITREQDVVFETAPGARHPVRRLLADRPRLHAPRARVRRGAPPRRARVPEGVRAGRPRRLRRPRSTTRSRPTSASASTRRVPRLAGMRRVGGVVGLYDVTPDWHPILGAVAEVEGLVLATGGSGHCFKLAPAIGDLVAASVLEGEGRVRRRRDVLGRALRRGARAPLDLRREPRMIDRPRDPGRHGPRRHRRRSGAGRRRDRGRPHRRRRRGAADRARPRSTRRGSS